MAYLLQPQKISKITTNTSEWERLILIAGGAFDDIFDVSPLVAIDTESNLNCNVLFKILDILNISDFLIEDRIQKLLNKGLLADRNAIAHGELKNVPISRVELYHQIILELLECYKDKLITMVTNDFHLVPQTTSNLQITKF